MIRRVCAALALVASLVLGGGGVAWSAPPEGPTLTMTPTTGNASTSVTVTGNCPAGGGSVYVNVVAVDSDEESNTFADTPESDGSFSFTYAASAVFPMGAARAGVQVNCIGPSFTYTTLAGPPLLVTFSGSTWTLEPAPEPSPGVTVTATVTATPEATALVLPAAASCEWSPAPLPGAGSVTAEPVEPDWACLPAVQQHTADELSRQTDALILGAGVLVFAAGAVLPMLIGRR